MGSSVQYIENVMIGYRVTLGSSTFSLYESFEEVHLKSGASEIENSCN